MSRTRGGGGTREGRCYVLDHPPALEREPRAGGGDVGAGGSMG